MLLRFLLLLQCLALGIQNSSSAKKRKEQPLDSINPSTKNYKCGVHIKKGCQCSKRAGTISITCFRADLKRIPPFDFGPTIVRTMNLESNNIAKVEIGDFFGLKIERLLLANNSISNLNFLAFWGLEYNLDTLDLGFNKFTTVPADALRLLRNVRTLSLTGNKIKTLRNYEFSYLHKLEVLSLDKNPIASMDDRTFAGTNLFMLILDEVGIKNGLQTIPTQDLSRLKGLSLKCNHIETIPPDWLKNMSSLKYLNLDENKLHVIEDDTFKGIEHTLRSLKMNRNRIRKIPRNAFRSLSNLESLDLSHNRIRKIYARSFNLSRALQSLDLSHNQISSLGVLALQGMDSLTKLDLRFNKLITLDDRSFYWKNLTDRKVYISENPWLCNCLLKWLKKAHRKRLPLAGLFWDLLDARCRRPLFLENRPLARVALRDFTCDHDYYYYELEEEEYTYDEQLDEDDEDDDNDEVIDGEYRNGNSNDDTSNDLEQETNDINLATTKSPNVT